MKLEHIEGVIFDLDETLIDAKQGLTAAHNSLTQTLQEYFDEKSVEIDRKQLLEALREFDDRMNRQLRYDRDYWWQQLIDEISPGIRLPREFVSYLSKKYWEAYEDAAIPYPDTLDTILYLVEKEYALAIVSDTDGKVGQKAERMRRLEFFEFFDIGVVAGDETTELKQTGIPFLLAADRLCIPPKRCIVIGDKPFSDIAGGKRAGMLTVLVVRRRWDAATEPDYEITTLSELRTIL